MEGFSGEEDSQARGEHGTSFAYAHFPPVSSTSGTLHYLPLPFPLLGSLKMASSFGQ